jgi:hypothetical protein
MSIPFDSVIAIKIALDMRLEYLDKLIALAEKQEAKENIIFWNEKKNELYKAILDFELAR